MTKDLTEGKPLPLIISFSISVLLGLLFQQFYNIVDTAIVGRALGANALAAVGCTGSVMFLLLGFCNGVAGGFTLPIAQKFGAKNFPLMRTYVWNAAFLCVAFSVVFTVGTALLCRPILVLMSTPPEILNDAVSYLRVIFLGIPFLFLYNFIANLMRALGDSKTPLYFLVASSLLNIFLDLFFIRVCGMGVAGAAKYDRLVYGVRDCMLISVVYSVVVFAIVFFFGKNYVLIFLENPSERILREAHIFLKATFGFYVALAAVNIYRFMIQGMGFSAFSMFSGFAEMVARAAIGIFAVPAFGIYGAVLGSPAAWILADCFLIPAFHHCVKKLKSEHRI